MPDTVQPLRFNLPSALLISLATVGLYWYSFCFEVGWALYFGYPTGLIPISLGLILNVWTFLFFYSCMAFGFLQLNLSHWTHYGKGKYALVVMLILFLALLMVIRGYAPKYTAFVVLFSSVAAYIGTLVMRRKLAAQKNEAPEKSKEGEQGFDVTQIATVYDARSKIPSESIAHRIVERLGFDPLLVFFFVVIVFPVMFGGAGYIEARSKQDFYSFSDSAANPRKEYLVLRILDGILIAVPYKKDSGTYVKAFLVRHAADTEGLSPVHVERVSGQ